MIRSIGLIAACMMTLGTGSEAGAAWAPPVGARQAEEAPLAVLPIREYSIQRIEAGAADAAGARRVEFSVGGEAMVMRVSPHSVRGAGFTVACRRGDELVAAISATPETTYRGWVEGPADIDAVVSIIDGQVVGQVFVDPADPWVIQPLSDFEPGADVGLHIVHRASDSIAPAMSCGNDHRMCRGECGGHGSGPALRGVGGPCLRTAEVLYETDYEFFQVYGDVAATVAGLEAYINQADFIYERDLGLSLATVQIIVNDVEPPVDHPYLVGTDPYAILFGFRDYWAVTPSPARDNVHLMIARTTGGIAGLAYYPGACAGGGFNSGLTRRYTENFNSIVVVLCHELGHNFFAPHDAQSGSPCLDTPTGHIMSPSVNTSLMTFSPCSINEMGAFLASENGSCVESSNPAAPVTENDAAAATMGVPVLIDVLSNDVSCETAQIMLASDASVGGAAIAISAGTGPYGRDEVMYTSNGSTPLSDSFTYQASNSLGVSGLATVNVANAPPRAPDSPGATGPGLDVGYYAVGSLAALPNFGAYTAYLETTSANIDYPSTDGNFADSGLAEQVGAVFEGFLEAETTGVYTLSTESDDGSRLLIGSTEVVSNDGLHGMQVRSGQIALQTGKHAIRVEFFENGGGAGLIVRGQAPGGTLQVIPASALSRSVPCAADYDGSGVADLPDIFAFLALWFANDAAADFNASGLPVDVPDIFAFLAAWFAGC